MISSVPTHIASFARTITSRRFRMRPCSPKSFYLPQKAQPLPRLFGSRPGSGALGEVLVENEQLHLRGMNLERLKENIINIRKLIGYETYDVALLLIDDEEMKAANKESRGFDEPTDILSYQFTEAVKPGELYPPEFDLPPYYNLGEMLVDVPYVMRGCQEDLEIQNKKLNRNDDSEDDEEEEDCRGVSGAMSMVFDPEERINMLLVHGMLHLVGYDHENDDDYELMVSKEEEVLKHLNLAPKEFFDKITQ